MKKLIFKYLLLAGLISGLFLTSCKKSSSGGGTNPDDPSNVAKSNLVAYFPFDGNGNDNIGGLTPSTVTSAVKFVKGQKGQAYQGDSLAYMLYNLTSASKLKNLRSFTVALWVKAPQVPSAVVPVPSFLQINGTADPNWGNLGLGEERSDADSLNLHFYFYDGDAVAYKAQHVVYSNPNFPAATWMHLVFSYDSATSKFNIYVKGIKISAPAGVVNRYNNDPTLGGGPLGSLSFAGATQLVIGTWWNLATGGDPIQAQNPWMGYFKGNMDELRIYNIALSDAEVTTLYSDEVSTLTP